MKKRTRILSLILAVLMIVGVMPMSVFAIDPADMPKSSDDEKYASVEEYVTANGGKLLLSTSFEDSSKITTSTDYNSLLGTGAALATRVNSNKSEQKGYVGFSFPGDEGSASWIENGKLRVETPKATAANGETVDLTRYDGKKVNVPSITDRSGNGTKFDLYPSLYGIEKDNCASVVIDLKFNLLSWH